MDLVKLANSKLVDDQAGIEDCERCLGEGRVPVFRDQEGIRLPVGTGRATAWLKAENEMNLAPRIVCACH
jgi:hypothetical protein